MSLLTCELSAQVLLSDLTRMQPANCPAWHRLGQIAEMHNDFRLAEESLQQALELYQAQPILPYSIISNL